MIVAALLRDMAAIRASRQRQWGYNGAADAVLALDRPLDALVQGDGTLERVPGVGPSSTRIAFEVIRTGESATVEQAVAESGRAEEIRRKRTLRTLFFSRARVLEILRDERPGAVRATDLLGDLQMHSTWSDGGASIAELAKACEARGYRYCGVTDHSYGLRIARGMSADAMRIQHQEIAALNKHLGERFRVFRSIEVNIQPDGTLDMARSDLELLDLVVAAPHSNLRTTEDQTSRLLAVVATPGVHVLAHPTGRKFGERAGIVARWDEVFKAAAALGVAIEIDGDPWRQDVNFVLAQEAVRAGCLIALDSDAHSPRELVYAETAVAHARLAGIPASKIINCWSADRLLEWAALARRR
ncbi:MAG TPA: PHP domain-containing protein [Vicinamibacterales bacterium]|nr:PHP domain-containing protein [Vicinamibacterales bacterium]